ncbi:MAG: hypothetical protein U1F98_10525 [Verrucomicrobiota bacterium]
MKAFAAVIVLSGFLLTFTGCSTSGNSAGRRFHDASSVNVVLQFSSWDYTFMVQPRYEDNGFLQPVRRDNLQDALGHFQVPHDTAVVVIGWNYDSNQLSGVVAEWKLLLGSCGFRRVVFLRSNAYNKLNGSRIIEDDLLFSENAQTARHF